MPPQKPSIPIDLRATGAPQISFTNWVLGGSLISRSGARSGVCKNENRLRTPSGSAGPEVKKTGSGNGNGKKEKEKDEKKEEKAEEKASEDDGLSGLEGLASLEAEIEAAVADSWTAAQDATILTMKKDGKTWNEIATKAGSGKAKDDVRERHKELVKNAPVSETDASGDGKEKRGNDKEKEKDKSSDKENGKKDEEGGKDNDKDGKPNGKGKSKEKDKNGGSANASDRGNGDVSKSNNERQSRLKPDDIWTRDDCEVLEMLEARYTDQKWLQMQAGFYNMTGRMVVAEVIERKFKEVG